MCEIVVLQMYSFEIGMQVSVFASYKYCIQFSWNIRTLIYHIANKKGRGHTRLTCIYKLLFYYSLSCVSLVISLTSEWNELQSLFPLRKENYTQVAIYMEKAMATHSSTLVWTIPWAEEPGRLKSMGSRRVGHDCVTSLSLFTFMHLRRKWQPTPVFLPGESQGLGSLVGCRLCGRTESDTTEATWQQQQQQLFIYIHTHTYICMYVCILKN